MTPTRSPGASPAMSVLAAAFAWAIGSPAMLPLVSITNSTSSGAFSLLASSAEMTSASLPFTVTEKSAGVSCVTSAPEVSSMLMTARAFGYPASVTLVTCACSVGSCARPSGVESSARDTGTRTVRAHLFAFMLAPEPPTAAPRRAGSAAAEGAIRAPENVVNFGPQTLDSLQPAWQNQPTLGLAQNGAGWKPPGYASHVSIDTVIAALSGNASRQGSGHASCVGSSRARRAGRGSARRDEPNVGAKGPGDALSGGGAWLASPGPNPFTAALLQPSNRCRLSAGFARSVPPPATNACEVSHQRSSFRPAEPIFLSRAWGTAVRHACFR